MFIIRLMSTDPKQPVPLSEHVTCPLKLGKWNRNVANEEEILRYILNLILRYILNILRH